MNERRLGGLLFVAGVAGGLCMLGSGCAQGGRGGGAADSATHSDADHLTKAQPSAGDGTESLVARGAAGLDQYLKKGRGAAQSDSVRNGQENVPAVNAAHLAERSAPVNAVEQPAPAAPATGAAPSGAAAVAGDARSGKETGEEMKKVVSAPDSAGPRETARLQPSPGAVLSGWWGEVNVGNEAGASTAKGVVVDSKTVVTPTAPVAGFWKSEETAGSGAFQISGLALCSRVDGFGKFAKVESVRATGKPVPLLIYTQLDGFAYRTRDGSSTATDDGKTEWVVEIGQSVVVYRMGADGASKGDVQVKVEPEQTARDVASFKRRDHFLVQRIELPTPLVPGKYGVKVTVRDKATGVVDERMTEVVVR